MPAAERLRRLSLVLLRGGGGGGCAPPPAARLLATRRRLTPVAAAPAAAPVAAPDGGRTTEVELSAEASSAYLSYAMSVIVGRALPDARDGLKPVHRRILFAMHDMGLRPGRPFRKCARVVGEVLGKYHPHGDQAVYDSLVRLAQDFVMGEPLVSGHGNFGSLDADPPAAMRYTECKLQPLADAMLLDDLSEQVVSFGSTFDGSGAEPSVLPARLPNLLLNGSQGIAVGMATSIPPHNLGEVVDALVLIARNPEVSLEQVMALLPAPDFPTGGELVAGPGIAAGYATGNGSFVLRGSVRVESCSGGRQALVIHAIPHGGNKATLVQRIAELVNERLIEGVSDVRDESDRDGMRVVIELRRGVDPAPLLAQLYAKTRLSVTVSMNMIALVDGAPRTLGLLDMLRCFVSFRTDVIRRRAAQRLASASERAHTVAGLLMALDAMDETVAAVRSSADGAAAAAALRARVGLSESQAAAVLAMPLRRLTGLEVGKLQAEAAELKATVSDLEGLLASEQRVTEVLTSEALELKARFGRPRRSALVSKADAAASAAAAAAAAASASDATAECLVTLSERGYLKRMSPAEFSSRSGGAAGRNTRGKAGGRLRADDHLERVLTCAANDTLILFTERGRAFALPAASVPLSGRSGGGTAVPQLAPLAEGEHATALLSVPRLSGGEAGASIVMLTQQGRLKRMPLAELANLKNAGLRVLPTDAGDALRFVRLAGGGGGETLLLASSDGHVLRFAIDDAQLRTSSRAARGVQSMELHTGAQLVGMDILPASSPGGDGGSDSDGGGGAESASQPDGEPALEEGPCALLVTKMGFAKRVPLALFRAKTRAKMGVRGLKLCDGDSLISLQVVGLPPHSGAAGAGGARVRAAGGEADGGGAGAAGAGAEEEVVVASEAGVINRCRVSAVTLQKRSARGSRLMKLDEGDAVRAVCILPGLVGEEESK